MESSDSQLPIAAEEAIDRIADEFERAFLAGESPSIEGFMGDGVSQGLPEKALLRELVCLEWELRTRVGQSPSVSEYERRFAADSSLIHQALPPASNPTQSTTTLDPSSSDALPDPESVGRFQIIRRLGSGGFGVVYLARDPQLDRLVAIKRPALLHFQAEEQADAFFREARSAAQLRHPGVVSVFDARLEDGVPYIVYEYVRGESLYLWRVRCKPTNEQIVQMLVQITTALQHAHEHGVVHCDMKLANILVDPDGRPQIADFGLSRVDHIPSQSGATFSGTPSMMAPEQILGQRQRIDARTDIWALGVMLYELLSGQKPFEGGTREELFFNIQNLVPPLPSELNSSSPPDLDAVCMKCLEKAPEDRFTSASAFAIELQSWLSRRASASLQPAKITPRGLRAFSEVDAGFFLSLLPGPRDSGGIPETIQFWKRRIESRETSQSFGVGLLYGPSGSGKTSFIRAGLVPVLDTNLVQTFVVGSADDCTADRLGKLVVGANAESKSLDGLFRELSEESHGPKRLIIIDQFEQWLHGRRSLAEAELTSALTHCNATSLQVLLVVRDDFFSSVNLLFQELAIPLREGRNYMLLPRFSMRHARHVLTELGRGYGVLGKVLTPANHAFVTRAIDELSENESVVGVRVALLAEMMKDRQWEPASLEGMGGVDGIGVRYLNDLIAGDRAAPHRRAAQEIIQRVLLELLPPVNSAIRGTAKSVDQLKDATQCDIADLINVCKVLDEEMRLITPADLASDERGSNHGGNAAGPQRYQLTHDFLVPTVRTWVSDQLKATRRGRALLKLQDFATLWEHRPKQKFLPGMIDWISLGLFTKRSSWSESQQKMMRSTTRLHTIRLGAVAIALSALMIAGYVFFKDAAANSLVEQIKVAEFDQVPGLLSEIDQNASWVVPKLVAARESIEDETHRLKLDLIILPEKPEWLDSIVDRLPTEEPVHMETVRQLLERYVESSANGIQPLKERLWETLEEKSSSPQEMIRATSLLAYFDRDNAKKWESFIPAVVEAIIREDTFGVSYWSELHEPVSQYFVPHLKRVLQDHTAQFPASQQQVALDLFAEYAKDNSQDLTDVIVNANPSQFRRLFPLLVERPDAAELLTKELQTQLLPTWGNESNLLVGSMEQVRQECGEKLEAASGLLNEVSAFCTTLPLAEFQELSTNLQRFGYRPNRVRPYRSEGDVRVAATWLRDGGKSTFDFDLTREEVQQRAKVALGDELVPTDITGYCIQTEGGLEERFCLLRTKNVFLETDTLACLIGIPEESQWTTEAKATQQNLRFIQSMTSYHDPEGNRRYCTVLSNQSRHSAVSFREFTRTELDDRTDLDRTLWDLSACETLSQSGEDYQKRRFLEFEATDNLQDWVHAIFQCPLAEEAAFHLEDFDKCTHLVDRALKRQTRRASLYYWRSRVQALRGKHDEAKADAVLFERLSFEPMRARGLHCIVAAYAGEEETLLAELEVDVESAEDRAEACFASAVALGACGKAYRDSDPEKHQRYTQRSLDYLQHAVDSGFEDWLRADRQSDLEDVRQLEGFAAIEARRKPQLLYSGVLCSLQGYEVVPVLEMPLDQHRQKALELASQGYRPRSVSVTLLEGSPIASSLWVLQRPRWEACEAFAARQANAAVALYRLGYRDAVWERLNLSPDPQMRTRVLHLLQELESEHSGLLQQIIQERDSTEQHVVERRRALLLALGEYEAEIVATDDVKSLMCDLFANDPDPGVHAACQWVMSQWGMQADIERINQKFATGKPEGNRKWYRPKNFDLTFAIIDGPVEFQSGFSSNDISLSRLSMEARTRSRIRRSYAISMTEVTHAQFWDLLRYTQVIAMPDEVSNWDDRCAVTQANWVMAELFCQSMNHGEKIPGREWIADPESFFSRVQLHPNYLSRTGYRLPTNFEWEYASRAGTESRFFFGDSLAYADSYVFSNRNADGRVWPVGTLKPNDFGLFDILGNAREHVLDETVASLKYGRGPIGDDVEDLRPVDPAQTRRNRGGGLNNPPRSVSMSSSLLPTLKSNETGFRVARTIPADW